MDISNAWLTLYLSFNNIAPMTLMHAQVNEWHSVKARNKCRNPNLSMLKDKQTCEAEAHRLIEPKIYEKEAKQNKNVKVKTKRTKKN